MNGTDPTPLAATSSQTIGPYWHLLADPALADLTRFGATGARIELTGQVIDGEGIPMTDACVEIWQASPENSELFDGWGRSATDLEGRYRFVTLKPGPVPGHGNSLQAPHIAVSVFARGLLHQEVTRAYFEGDALNEVDPVLSLVEETRRGTLLSRQDPRHPDCWVFDIRMQGDGETVFLEF